MTELNKYLYKIYRLFMHNHSTNQPPNILFVGEKEYQTLKADLDIGKFIECHNYPDEFFNGMRIVIDKSLTGYKVDRQ